MQKCSLLLGREVLSEELGLRASLWGYLQRTALQCMMFNIADKLHFNVSIQYSTKLVCENLYRAWGTARHAAPPCSSTLSCLSAPKPGVRSLALNQSFGWTLLLDVDKPFGKSVLSLHYFIWWVCAAPSHCVVLRCIWTYHVDEENISFKYNKL